MSIPTELTAVLVQFPVAALVLLTAWGVVRWTDRRTNAELAREQARTQVAVQDADRARSELREVERRLNEWLGGEVTRLRTRNTELYKILDKGRGPPPMSNT